MTKHGSTLAKTNAPPQIRFWKPKIENLVPCTREQKRRPHGQSWSLRGQKKRDPGQPTESLKRR